MPDALDIATAMYTCRACGDNKVRVKVRKAYSNESPKAYAEFVGDACSVMHRIRNPYCARGMFDLFVPVPKER